jgi:hypothetical protein
MISLRKLNKSDLFKSFFFIENENSPPDFVCTSKMFVSQCKNVFFTVHFLSSLYPRKLKKAEREKETTSDNFFEKLKKLSINK